MGRAYIIRSGCSFVQPDGSKLTGGDTIELDDDVAKLHADKVDPAPVDPDAGATGDTIPAPIEPS